MEDSPHLYISEIGTNEDLDEGEEEEEEEDEENEDDINQEETNMQPDMVKAPFPDIHKHADQDTERGRNSFPCLHCEGQFTSKQGLEQHTHTHALENHEAPAYKSHESNMSQSQQEKTKLPDSGGSVVQFHSSSPATSNTSVVSPGDLGALPDRPGVLEGRHACKYCEKMFTTQTKKRRHERRMHEQHLQVTREEKSQLAQEENLQKMLPEPSQQETEVGDNSEPAAVLENDVVCTEHYMLDVSSNISENLSFYIDGKIVSTSTVSSCEASEIPSGSSSLVGLDALILHTAQISQVLNADSVASKDIPGQPQVRRRTATPPLLPQIRTELESEGAAPSSSSSLVSSLIENLLPQNTGATVGQKERTVFLSPKLKQLLEKQDGLKPTLALIADAQKPCSPVSLSVLAAGTGRFKRRTGSPPSSPQQSPTSKDETADGGGGDAVSTGQVETQPVQQTATVKDDPTQTPSEEPAVKPVSTESWPPAAGGNSCNQQPLDLSNTVKRNEELTLAEAVLDLSLQKSTLVKSEVTLDLVSRAVLKAGNFDACMAETALINVGEQNVSLGNPLVTDFTILTGPDVMTPMESMAEGLVYGLALPSGSLTPSTASLTPVALQPASPCTIAFASPVSHTVLPTASSLITVLAPSNISNAPIQPIQLLAPDMSPEPLVICTENAFNFSECDLATAFATTDSTEPVALSQSLDPTLNLRGNVFLCDQIALNQPLVESNPMSEQSFTPTASINDSLISSYNITSNTVLIECNIALEAPGRVVPAAESLAPMVVNQMEQQEIVSAPNPQTLGPSMLMSSIAESVTLSATDASGISDCPAVGESSLDPELVVNAKPPSVKEEEAADGTVSLPEISSSNTSTSLEQASEDESSDSTLSDAQEQNFTKNFICNVCDRLFHSMKELGHHVGDHADEWPYKCEFCVLLFSKPSALLDHRSSLHGVGRSYVCSACTKEFVYLCNLKQHQDELHPGQQCTYTEEEKGKLRPQNYNNSIKDRTDAAEEPEKLVKKEENVVDVAADELLTTIKILASDGAKVKGPDVRLGINQHYPSFKPPPFPYHNRSPAGSVASATNFTTHNIPQTFSTAIRCTKCGKSFDNMPELHKHILACANASDKRRYTPKRNPIPLRHFAKTQNGVLSTTNTTNGLNASNRPNRSKPSQDSPVKVKFKVLKKRKKKLAQRVMPQRNKSAPSSNKMSPARVDEPQEVFVCPHCSREFTMRRSRTKHMAVCPKKPKEGKKRKDGGISVTKENDGHQRRRVEEKQQSSPRHKTRLQSSASSGPAKRPAILPVQAVFSSKRSKIIIKESTQPKPETPALNEPPVVRTFNPSMRQYTRVQHGVKGLPIKITIVKQQQAAPQKDELLPTQSRAQFVSRAATGSSEPTPTT
uniref:PR domain zinc finger protein 2 n=1 Tax=Gasterosteus aculeatus aculeatus TaxID=481459 RepID=UPI001A998AC3|nr:PR domain zinc finger protein 2 [Gasterosteus aculeatus aculeatus]XP_040049203.1 PR domain zinc finger protein 2 [Gasterosteus aculeatus aculeatus]XP_040049204.1 PR domain zinc finger protein 2 [Gasterosteus aculeatus aculeatus]